MVRDLNKSEFTAETSTLDSLGPVHNPMQMAAHGGRTPPLSLGQNVMMTIDTTLAAFGRLQRRDDDAIFRLKKVVIGDAIDISRPMNDLVSIMRLRR